MFIAFSIHSGHAQNPQLFEREWKLFDLVVNGQSVALPVNGINVLMLPNIPMAIYLQKTLNQGSSAFRQTRLQIILRSILEIKMQPMPQLRFITIQGNYASVKTCRAQNRIDIQNLAKGIYFVKVSNSERFQYKSLLKCRHSTNCQIYYI